jgi:hypothetical protein
LDFTKARISESTTEKYRNLASDLQSLKDNPGLMKFILDTLIDLDLLSEELVPQDIEASPAAGKQQPGPRGSSESS